MNSYSRNKYLLILALRAFTAVFCISSHAMAAILSPCVPNLEIYTSDPVEKAIRVDEEYKKCDAENAVYSAWEPKLAMLENARHDLEASTNAGNWEAYLAKWAEVMPILKELRTAASENQEAAGARNLISLYGQDLGFLLQNAGLNSASDLEGAAANIVAGMNGSEAPKAASVGMNLVRQSMARGTEFVRGLGAKAGNEVGQVRKAKKDAEDRQRQTQHSEEMRKNIEQRLNSENTSGDGYFAGLGKRIGSVWSAWLFYLVVACFIGAWLGTKRRQNPIMSGIVAGTAYVIPGIVMMLALIFLPFLPQWFLLVGTVAGTVAMYYYGSHVFRWLAARFGADTPIGKQLLIIGGMFEILQGGVKPPSNGVVAEMAAENATHGSARWGTVAEMRQGGHLVELNTPAGFALARAGNTPSSLDQRFYYTGHVVTVAPTGSGKGIGAVIPNLLDYPGSALVLDVKGENAAVTARARRELGQKVFVVDPFGVTKGETHAFNLLDRLNPNDPECVSESAMLADCLVIVDAKGSDGAHFDESAKTLLQGLMLYVVGQDDPAKRNLGELRRMITTGEEEFDATLAMMAADDAYAFGIPARAANTLMGMADRERGSVLSTARRHTAFLDDPRIAAALSHSDFDLAKIKSELMTVYLVLPANKIGTNARFVRGFIGAIIAAITSSSQQPPHRVAFLLDEFGQLGYMKSIEDAVSLLRGYGLSFWVFIQDLSQLKGVYPKWQTFLANSAKTFYGTDDYDTAKYVSDSLGQATIEFETHNEGKNSGGGLSGGGGSMNRGASSGSSQQFTGRHLLTPDEVMRLGPERPIILLKGEYPYQLTRLNYLVDAEYVGKADPNPYHT